MVALEYILLGAVVGVGVGAGAAALSAEYESAYRDLAGAVPHARPAVVQRPAPPAPERVPTDPAEWPTP